MLVQKINNLLKTSELADKVVIVSLTHQRQPRVNIEFKEGVSISIPTQINVSDDELLTLILSTYEKKLTN